MIEDLRRNLSNNFRLYNEINCKISNLKITPYARGALGARYRVDYDIEITSKIYARRIRHTEKSSVSEIVEVENGKAKIVSTMNGSYWYVK